MGFWTFVAIAVVCGCLLEGYRIHAKSKAKSRSASGGPRMDDIEARLAALEGNGNIEERVRALEAIVTDPKSRLEREIDGLER